MAAIALIKNQPRGAYRDGQIIDVQPFGPVLGSGMQPGGAFVWLVFDDREVEDIRYLTEKWTHQLTFEEVNPRRTRFISESVSASNRFAFTAEYIQPKLDATNNEFDGQVTVSLFNISARNFTCTFDWAQDNSQFRNDVYAYLINQFALDHLEERRWSVKNAGMQQIRNAGGTLNGTFNDLRDILQDGYET